ncbi:hypothetical protein L2E82_13776 [Cichorium intybus]|uniref:Uncharacterized protein n=1 Tax=Cichorium intybus TaxID=13427 RepID=A0ACB9EXK8_CICIN|nr:hypothetical protein L2E82_13776 [Cichorium intybus]
MVEIDKKADIGGGVNGDVENRMFLAKELADINRIETLDVAQKAKVKWAIEGDENSKFFHGILNKRRRNTAVRGVFSDGRWIEEPKLVKEEFRKHFAERFAKPDWVKPQVDQPFSCVLSVEQSEELESEVTMEEVKRAVWDCGSDKAPGPDGFTFEFFKKFWYLAKSEVVDAVKCFFNMGHFPSGCNASFIALIPKVQQPKFVKDYRPISLIGCQYKIIGKLLANRLANVIDGIVSKEQSAFIKGRQILDGPFILNELASWCKYKREKAYVFKVDFQKAYDSVRWDHLIEVMLQLGFGERWRCWISSCLHSATSSVLVNGSPTDQFQLARGLRQGDPLSPFLFILVMESLHIMVQRVMERGLMCGFTFGRSIQTSISHLFYADDTIFIGSWDKENVDSLVSLLHVFHLVSGLSINLQKSKLLGLGVTFEEVQHMATSTGCEPIKLPFDYLGLLVGGA